MLKPYERRAFLVLLLAALEPVAAAHASGPPVTTTRGAPAAPSDTLWDALANPDIASLAHAGDAPAVVERVPLGPVPGFSLPGSKLASKDSFFGKKMHHTGFLGGVFDWFDDLADETGSKVKVTGHETLTLAASNVSGGASGQAAFTDSQYLGQGSNGIYNDANMTVDATVFQHFHYQTEFNNSPFSDPYQNRTKMDYTTKSLNVQIGDINAGFQGNSLIDFSRYLMGVQFTDQWTRQLKTSLLYTRTEATPRTITIPGNNSSGPYYVYSGQIVDGSAQVRVDNKDMVQGQDYTLDSYTGQLNFLHGLIIAATSTITVTMETYDYGQSSGTIMGLRTEYAPKPGMSFGLTYADQQNPLANTTQQESEQHWGSGTPNSLITLNAPVDTTKPLQVYLNGLLMVAGTEYIFQPQLPQQIIVVPPVPTSQIITVKYYPALTNAEPGNTSVLGFDGKLGLGKIGTLSMEGALSGISLSGQNVGGKAVNITADLNPLRSLHTRVELKDVGSTFTGIASPGFNQNEKSLDVSADYSPMKRLKLNLSWEDALRPSYTSALSTTTENLSVAGYDKYNQYTLNANYQLAKNAALSLSRSSIDTAFAIGGTSSNLSNMLNLNYGLKAVTFSASVGSNTASSIGNYDLLSLDTTGAVSATGTGTTGAAGATGSQGFNTSSDNFTKQLGVHWQARNWLTLGTNYTDDSIKNNSAGTITSDDARDMQVTADVTPTKKLKLNYSFDLSDTGTQGATTTTTGTSLTGASVNPTLSTGLTGTPVGSTGATNTIGFGSAGFGTVVGGGGSASTLGGAGNYSGLYGQGAAASSLLNGFAGSYGGRSMTQHVSLSFNPRTAMQMGVSLDHSDSIGSYEYNSSRDNLGFNFNWQATKRIDLNANYTISRILYTGGFGGTDSSVLQFFMSGRPFGGKLSMQLSWQSMITTGSVNLTAATTGTTGTTGTTTGTSATGTSTDTSATNENSDLTSVYLRLDYPILRRISLFSDLTLSLASGYLAENETELQFGLDYALTQVLKFSLGWQSIMMTDATASAAGTPAATTSYHANSLLAQFGFRF